MNSTCRTTPRSVIVLSLTVLLSVHTAGRADPTVQELTMEATTKSLVVVKFHFPAWGDVTHVRGTYSDDGEDYQYINMKSLGWGELYRSSAHDDTSTTLLVPIVADFQAGFLFSEPSRRYLKWVIGFREAPGVVVRHTVTVLPARQDDLLFIDRLADPEFQRHLFGKEYFEKRYSDPEPYEWVLSPKGKDHRVLTIIKKLLKATREKEPGTVVGRHKSINEALKWADTLSALAKELPESSYAPYAAYYAGCCYLGILQEKTENMAKERGIKDREITEQDVRSVGVFVAENPFYTKASDILSLAVSHADTYLKPRALYMQALLRATAGNWEEADCLFDKAMEAAPGQGTIATMVGRIRGAILKEREKIKRRTHREKEQEHQP